MKLKYPLAKKLTERVSVGGGDSDALQMKASSSKKSLCSPYFIFAEFAVPGFFSMQVVSLFLVAKLLLGNDQHHTLLLCRPRRPTLPPPPSPPSSPPLQISSQNCSEEQQQHACNYVQGVQMQPFHGDIKSKLWNFDRALAAEAAAGRKRQDCEEFT